MKIELTKEWCMRMAQLEGDAAIGAGPYAFDPTFDHEPVSDAAAPDESNVVFGRFVRLMRRRNGLTVEKLAQDADVEVTDLIEIEDDTRHKPEPRTVYQLAQYFKVPQNNLMQVAGLTAPRDTNLLNEAIRFAARSDPVAQLTPEEQAALEAFVVILNEQK
jgi:HTH-type transcriptional regulator, competence development regulator